MAKDSQGRRIDYLRISITDRCNLRCVYCMPADGVVWRSHEDILSYEEIELFTKVAVEEGISKVRLTGGEPLVRRGIVEHVERMAGIVGPDSLALTTNGILLPTYAEKLAAAGLARVNVSLDTLDPETFRRVTRGGEVEDVLAGIRAAIDAGMSPVKINVVVARRFEQDLGSFAAMTIDQPTHVRFIEYMPLGACGTDIDGGTWSQEESVSSDEILERLTAYGESSGLGAPEPVGREGAPGGWGPARYLKFAGAQGTLGLISPLSHHFCGECNRLRLTADGLLRPCLFDDHELSVREALAQGEDAVREVVRRALQEKPTSHGMRVGTLRSMSQIGG